MLKLASTEPAWIALFPNAGDGKSVEVQFAPITIAAARAARRAIAAALNIDSADAENAGDEMSRELIRRGVLAWRGIGDHEGTPIDVTAEAIEVFLADTRTFEAADRLYVLPWVKLDMEGNGLSASPDGTGQAEMRAADTAKRSASSEKTAAAARKRTKREKAAPISPKPSRPKRVTPPGT